MSGVEQVRRHAGISHRPACLSGWRARAFVRLRAYRQWLQMAEPDWAALGYPPIDYQEIIYYAAPKQQDKKASLDEVDPKLLETFDKLGISLNEQKRLSGVAVDAVVETSLDALVPQAEAEFLAMVREVETKLGMAVDPKVAAAVLEIASGRMADKLGAQVRAGAGQAEPAAAE